MDGSKFVGLSLSTHFSRPNEEMDLPPSRLEDAIKPVMGFIWTGVRAGVIRRRTYPAISVVLFYELAIVVVVKCWVALHAFLLTELMVLSFRTVHRGVNNLRRNKQSYTTESCFGFSGLRKVQGLFTLIINTALHIIKFNVGTHLRCLRTLKPSRSVYKRFFISLFYWSVGMILSPIQHFYFLGSISYCVLVC